MKALSDLAHLEDIEIDQDDRLATYGKSLQQLSLAYVTEFRLLGLLPLLLP